MGLRPPSLLTQKYLYCPKLPLKRASLDILDGEASNEEVKLVKLCALIFLLVLPQIHQAWGTDHCVSDCHKEETQHYFEENGEQSSHEGQKAPEKKKSHHHAHQCVHSFALLMNFTKLQNPNSEFKKLAYHFTVYESEPHLRLFIEPPILSLLTVI